MTDDWYHAEPGGQQQGPVPFASLQEMARQGSLSHDHLVWREGMPQWVPAGSLPELFAQAGYPAPALDYANAARGVYRPGYAAPFHPEYGGFWIRVGAAIIDSLILGAGGFVVGFVIGFVVGAVMAGSGSTTDEIRVVAEFLGQIAGLVMGWLYSALLESSSHQATLGKMAVGLRVTDMYGDRISFGRATGRHFAKILSALILGIGFIMVAFTERKQGLHDQMAGTLVIRRR